MRLLEAVSAGDQLALRELYERSHRLVFTLIVRITRNRETAESSRWTCFTIFGGGHPNMIRRAAPCSDGS